ncbi:MAG: sulfotransferase family protein [Phycisphaerales bacterium]
MSVPPEHPEPAPLRLIAGMSRAGTTWVGKCFNEHPDTVCFGESLFWGRRFVEPASDGRYDQDHLDRIAANMKRGNRAFLGDGPGCHAAVPVDSLPALVDTALADLPARPTPLEVFDRLGREYAARQGKRFYVEKTPHNILWIDRIMRFNPQLRMVVLVRDPYEFMLSYKHQGDRKDPELRDLFHRLYHPIGCATVWRGYMRSSLTAASRFASHTHMVLFDDLVRNPAEEMRRMQDFFELEPHAIESRVPPDNTSFPRADRPELAPEDVFWMNLIAGGVMKRMDAERRRARIRPWRLLGSVCSLVPWAWRSYRQVSTTSSEPFWRYLTRWAIPDRNGSAANERAEA